MQRDSLQQTSPHDARIRPGRKPRRGALSNLILLAALLLACTASPGAEHRYRVETIADNLHWPWSVVRLPGGDFLVSERSGQLVHLHGNGGRSVVSGTPPTLFTGQGGYFDIALDPDFVATRLLFLSYVVGPAQAHRVAVFRGRYEDGRLLDGRRLLSTSPPRRTPRNFGGRMLFLPDRSLLLTSGDDFAYPEVAQSLGSEHGKVLRIDVNGKPGYLNPHSDEIAERIWSAGHRNPQGLAYDAELDVIYALDHGPRGGDELNVLAAGANYGWPMVTSGMDGSGALISPFEISPYSQDPLWTWTPAIGPSSIAVYRGREFPRWNGSLLVGSLASRELRLVRMHKGAIVGEVSLLRELDERIRDVRVFAGEIYVLTDGADGRLLRLRRR